MIPRAAQKTRFREDVAAWADRLGVQPSGVYIQKMTAKWASCSASGRVCFSLDLLAQPRPFREVVIVHELLHLRLPNHGRLFKSLLSAHLPGWRQRLRQRRLLETCPGHGRSAGADL
jgi:predicted metal-dependent hydrolase